MTRHARSAHRFTTSTKETKVNTTGHDANAASTPKAGLFAALRGLLTGKGSGLSKISFSQAGQTRSLVVLCALAGIFALSTAAVAQAEAPTLISYGSFNAVTDDPGGVAVDNSGLTFDGDVYVAGLSGFLNPEGPSLDKFEPSGQAISPSPFGETNLIASLAVNPSNGDLYALSSEGSITTSEGSITTYDSSSGAPIKSFPVTLPPGPGELFEFLENPPQIAADAAGNVYLPNAVENEVLEYSSEGTLLQTFTGGSGPGALKSPTGVAVDASGNVWVADKGDNRIEELSAADAPIGEVRSEGVESVALDGHGDVLAMVRNKEDFCGKIGGESGECSHLVEYSPTGAKLADLGAGSFESGEQGFMLPPLVAVNESSGRVYVTDSSNRLVWVFGSPTAPSVIKELASEVDTSGAKLGAVVNPGGIPTTFRFEYGTTSAYGSSVPFPEGSAGEGIATRTVWAAASGLAPGATYHYRVVATSELGTAYGVDRTFTTLTAAQATCPNEETRGSFSARLPDCRAYELVTAPTSNSVEAEFGGRTAADGGAVSFAVNDPLPGAPSGNFNEYLATRGAGGWSSEDLRPLESYSETTCMSEDPESIFSAEFSKSVTEYGHNTRASEPTGGQLNRQTCNAEGLQVVPGEPVGYQNLLLRDNTTGTYQLINQPPAGVTPADAKLHGASADLSHVLFSEEAPLAQGAQYGVENLYEWDEGTVRLLTVMPDGTPAQGSLPEQISGTNVISAGGSHILFISGGSLYVRIGGEHTVQVDESQGGGGSSGGGSFQAASADGTEIFFTDNRRLTADSTAETGEPDLYECAVPEGASKCVLSDLTVAQGGEHADVIRVSPLGAKDSSHLYFVARGVLASNTREYTDGEGNVVLEKAQAGQNNLYLWSGGTTTFIASGPPDGYPSLNGAGQASPDGTWFVFGSDKSLTGYDNMRAQVVAPANELFLYSAASNQLACVSCDPSGEAPTDGGTELEIGRRFGSRYVSNGGRVFFDTPEALVPSDTNGQTDVYEYEDGHLHLISSGTSPRGSSFTDASESGDDVFFFSTQALVPQDNQEGMKAIYDARVDGGFPAGASPPACTTADACRTPVSPQPSIYGAPASQTFSGAGNLAPPAAKPKAKPKAKPVKCRKGFVKKKGKCVKKPPKKAKKSARANRRGK
jgi:DNA-binding beta-propeller fold protein YncE